MLLYQAKRWRKRDPPFSSSRHVRHFRSFHPSTAAGPVKLCNFHFLSLPVTPPPFTHSDRIRSVIEPNLWTPGHQLCHYSTKSRAPARPDARHPIDPSPRLQSDSSWREIEGESLRKEGPAGTHRAGLSLACRLNSGNFPDTTQYRCVLFTSWCNGAMAKKDRDEKWGWNFRNNSQHFSTQKLIFFPSSTTVLGHSVDYLIDWLIIRFIFRLVDWLIDWFSIDWLIDWLIGSPLIFQEEKSLEISAVFPGGFVGKNIKNIKKSMKLSRKQLFQFRKKKKFEFLHEYFLLLIGTLDIKD